MMPYCRGVAKKTSELFPSSDVMLMGVTCPGSIRVWETIALGCGVPFGLFSPDWLVLCVVWLL